MALASEHTTRADRDEDFPVGSSSSATRTWCGSRGVVSGSSRRLMERGKGQKGWLRELFDRGCYGFSGKGRTIPATAAAAIFQWGASVRADPSSHGPRASCAYHGARTSAPRLRRSSSARPSSVPIFWRSASLTFRCQKHDSSTYVRNNVSTKLTIAAASCL